MAKGKSKNYPLDKAARQYWKQAQRVQEIKKAFFNGECSVEDVIGSLCLMKYSVSIATNIVGRWDNDRRAGVTL